MAISDNYVPIRQAGNGVTTMFSASWQMLAAAYAAVFLEDAVTGIQTPQTGGGVNYSLVFSSSGFTVTFTVAPPVGKYAVIGRSVTLDQIDPYRTSKGFQGEVIEASFDKLTAITQDLSDTLGRAIVLPLGDTSAVVLPSASVRANQSLIFDALGAPTVGQPISALVTTPWQAVIGSATIAAGLTAAGFSAFTQTLLASASAIAFRATLGAAASGANADITTLSAITSINGDQLAGFRNKLINGNFRRWEYGTAYTTISTSSYGAANNWFVQSSASTTEHCNQDTSITAGLGFKFNVKMGRNAAGVNTSPIILGQALESVNSIPLAGQTVTLSYYAKKGANYSAAGSLLTTALYTGTGTDQSSQNMINGSWTSQVQAINANDVLTTAWQRFQHSVTLGAGITQVGMEFVMTPVGVAGADDNYYIAGVQLEIGAQATPFEDRGETIEDILCQRTLPSFTFLAASKVTGFFGQCGAAATGFVWCPWRVRPRAAPSSVVISAAAHFSVFQANGNPSAVTGLVLSTNTSIEGGQLDFSGAAGLVAGNATQLSTNNASAKFIFKGAEL